MPWKFRPRDNDSVVVVLADMNNYFDDFLFCKFVGELSFVYEENEQLLYMHEIVVLIL